MDRNEAFDKILEYLYRDPNKKQNLIVSKKDLGIDDRNLIRSICDEMIEKHKSYSSFIEFEKVAQKKAQRSKITPDVIKIGTAIIFGLSTAILGWLNYIDGKKIDSRQNEIELLNKTIDSLNNELKNLKQKPL